MPPSYILQMSRILESATRRYLAAVRELARVRKLQAGTRVQGNAGPGERGSRGTRVQGNTRG
jgi:hypothetical protein